jgi:hypothetical protein
VAADSFFALAITAMVALFFGSVLAFAGYRFFLVLLPIFGFLFGFGLGAQTVQAIFGEGFLSTLTSWLAGFFVALVFALTSYIFYIAAVSILGGALGYALATGLLMAFGLDFGFLVWLVGIIAGLVFAIGVVLLNIQKYVVIAATALLGAGIIVGTFLFLFGGLPPAELTQNPVRHVLQSSPFWMLVFLAVAALGAAGQFVSTRHWEIDTYNRWDDLSEPELTPAGSPVTSP